MINIGEYDLKRLLTSAAHLGATNALRSVGLNKSQVSKATAYKQYSRRRIDGWITEEIIKPIFNGTKTLLNVSELEEAAQAFSLLNPGADIKKKTA